MYTTKYIYIHTAEINIIISLLRHPTTAGVATAAAPEQASSGCCEFGNPLPPYNKVAVCGCLRQQRNSCVQQTTASTRPPPPPHPSHHNKHPWGHIHSSTCRYSTNHCLDPHPSHRNKHPRGRIHSTPGSRTPAVARPHRLVPHKAAIAHFHRPLSPRRNGASVVLSDVAHETGVTDAHEPPAAAAGLRGTVDLFCFF